MNPYHRSRGRHPLPNYAERGLAHYIRIIAWHRGARAMRRTLHPEWDTLDDYTSAPALVALLGTVA